MDLKTIYLPFEGRKIPFKVRPDTQDEPMALGEVFNRDYYRQWGKLEIKTGDIVVDLGANCGSFSILASLNGAKKVIAVEPHPETIEILKENVKDFLQVKIVEAAVVRELEEKSQLETKLYICPDPHGTGSHTATLKGNDDPLKYKHIKVNAITLDEIIGIYDLDRIDFLKLDIEGAEYEIFENCTRLDRIRQISMEWHYGPYQFTELLRFLIKNGFRVAWFEGDKDRGKLQVIRGE